MKLKWLLTLKAACCFIQHIVQILCAKNKTRWAVLYLGVLTTAFTNWLQTIGQQLEVENLTRCDGSVRSTNTWMGQVFFGNYFGL